MTTKQDRLCEVYDYLRAKKGIHTQVGFADDAWADDYNIGW